MWSLPPRLVLVGFLLSWIATSTLAAPTYPPVVLMHGITGDASDTHYVDLLIKKTLPGVYVCLGFIPIFPATFNVESTIVHFSRLSK